MASIDSLTKGAASYDEASIHPLEEFLSSQIAGEAPYNFNANKTLVKLYKCFPKTAKAVNYASILTLAVQQFPDMNDFSSLMCLIPEEVQKHVDCSSIINAAEALEGAKFERFWKDYDDIGNDNVREGILVVFSQVYQSIEADVVAKSLDMTPAQLSDFVAGKAVVESVKDGKVTFISTAMNSKKDLGGASLKSLISMDALTSVMQPPQ
mmetsp:Transcript_5156/g.7001  ORF Transcript_5156/g.7001 Transcript_5156/m.7001 type:complete len:209 (-) Transcript_5156:241-867(-)|eukprot:CAMPEP_0116062912 /NCGR_PEP_ID=MMETSP0322-20121206/8068_1 /TAXON_ID=163516 /ORGANISM="Leptocylindrus danicus var. apora, Strain B651" /LENGTH=208 /DNA_ID=CAMNT_0003548363 /DNA_START=79 /DNA_END=705 /DNA_ORIENTATION=+